MSAASSAADNFRFLAHSIGGVFGVMSIVVAVVVPVPLSFPFKFFVKIKELIDGGITAAADVPNPETSAAAAAASCADVETIAVAALAIGTILSMAHNL